MANFSVGLFVEVRDQYNEWKFAQIVGQGDNDTWNVLKHSPQEQLDNIAANRLRKHDQLENFYPKIEKSLKGHKSVSDMTQEEARMYIWDKYGGG
eukprot:UN27096